MRSSVPHSKTDFSKNQIASRRITPWPKSTKRFFRNQDWGEGTLIFRKKIAEMCYLYRRTGLWSSLSEERQKNQGEPLYRRTPHHVAHPSERPSCKNRSNEGLRTSIVRKIRHKPRLKRRLFLTVEREAFLSPIWNPSALLDGTDAVKVESVPAAFDFFFKIYFQLSSGW